MCEKFFPENNMNSPARLLILGGSGFLSGTLARVALAQGWAVTTVTRGQRPVTAGATPVQADRQDRAGFARSLAALDGTWDLVVDAIPFTPDDARQDVAVFTGRTGRLVFVSTDFVYDPRQRSNPQPERAASYAAGGYGGLKRGAELVLQQTAPKELPWTILRPGHIYGPGSHMGCLPLQSRNPQLIDDILARRPLQLVDGGRFLQQPVFAPDLAETILDAPHHPRAAGGIFNVVGPDIVESRDYYRVLASLLERDVTIEEVPVAQFLAENPDKAPFCCDRVYDLTALRAAGPKIPATTLANGLRQQLEVMRRGSP